MRRVEVHLTDENSGSKSVDNDKRCVMETHLAGLQPITVTDQSATLEQALGGAAHKLEKTPKRTLGRLDDPKGRTRDGQLSVRFGLIWSINCQLGSLRRPRRT